MQRAIIVLLIILIVSVIGIGGWLGYLMLSRPDTTPPPSTQQPTTSESETTTDRTYTSPKGVRITLHDWREQMTLISPALITGTVPGSWSFEASFPVRLLDTDGNVVAEAPAQLQGDWMSDNQVPFSVTLIFDSSANNTRKGTLVLEKDNPSDLAENADAITIAIQY